MDQETFKLVDGMLANIKDADGRETAKTLLSVAARGGHLQMAAEVVARRFGLRPDALLGWYAESLEIEADAAIQTARELMNLRGENGRE